MNQQEGDSSKQKDAIDVYYHGVLPHWQFVEQQMELRREYD